MTHSTPLAAATFAALAAFVTPANANPFGQLHNYAGQISAQTAVVGAQAHALFDDCAYGPLIADDVFDELGDLQRRLDRLCTTLATGPPTRGTLRRIERDTHRVHRQAQELDAEIRDAIAELRRRELRRTRHAFRQPLAYGVPVTPHLYARNRGGVNLSFGNGRVQLNLAANHPAARHLANSRFATRHVVGYPTIGYGHGLHGIAAHGWARQPQADALCAQSERLLRMTSQLVAIVCG